MPIIGAYATVRPADREAVARSLAALPEVEVVPAEDLDKVGMVVEAPSLRAARDLLEGSVQATDGVLAVWPVYVNAEDEFDPQETTNDESQPS